MTFDKPNRLLRLRDVADAVGVHPSHVFDLIKRHGFPTQIHIGKASRWSEQEVQAWIAQRIEQERQAS